MAEAMVETGVAVIEGACARSSRRWTMQGGAREQWKWRAGQKEQAATEAYTMRAGDLTGGRGTGQGSSKLGAVVNGDGHLG